MQARNLRTVEQLGGEQAIVDLVSKSLPQSFDVEFEGPVRPVLHRGIHRRPHALPGPVEQALDIGKTRRGAKAGIRGQNGSVLPEGLQEVGIGDFRVQIPHVGTRHVQQHSEFAAVRQFIALGREQVEIGADVVALAGGERPDRSGDLPAGEVEGPPRPNVDEAGKAGLDEVRRGGLENLERGNVRRGEILQRDDPGLGREYLASVIGGREIGKTANEHVLRFAALPVDLHARDSGRRLSRVEIGKLADVLGHHGIDDLLGVPADVLRGLEASADACDDDVFAVRVIGRILRIHRVDGRVPRLGDRIGRRSGVALRQRGRGGESEDGEGRRTQDERLQAHDKPPPAGEPVCGLLFTRPLYSGGGT